MKNASERVVRGEHVNEDSITAEDIRNAVEKLRNAGIKQFTIEDAKGLRRLILEQGGLEGDAP